MEQKQFDELIRDVGKRISECLYTFRRSNYAILCAINSEETVTMSKLAKHLDVSLPRCSTLIKTMEEKELVKVLSPKKDKRVRLISITELGKQTLQKNRERLANMYDRLRDYYGEEDFNTLCNLLAKSEHILSLIKEEEQNA